VNRKNNKEKATDDKKDIDPEIPIDPDTPNLTPNSLFKQETRLILKKIQKS